jgi:hypothetical protein
MRGYSLRKGLGSSGCCFNKISYSLRAPAKSPDVRVCLFPREMAASFPWMHSFSRHDNPSNTPKEKAPPGEAGPNARPAR